MVQSADETGPGIECKAVADERPEHGDDGHHGEALHHGGEHILFADETAVKERESGTGHHEHKCCADEHPSVVGTGLGGGDLGLELRNLSSSGNRWGSRLRDGWKQAAGTECQCK